MCTCVDISVCTLSINNAQCEESKAAKQEDEINVTIQLVVYNLMSCTGMTELSQSVDEILSTVTV